MVPPAVQINVINQTCPVSTKLKCWRNADEDKLVQEKQTNMFCPLASVNTIQDKTKVKLENSGLVQHEAKRSHSECLV